MISYAPLHAHSFFSLLDGLTDPKDMVRRAIQVGAPSIAVTDHGGIAAVPSFFRAAESACSCCGYPKSSHKAGSGQCLISGVFCSGYQKSDIKPIAGNEFYLSQLDCTIKDKTNRSLSHLVVLAKNKNGWGDIMRATSSSNEEAHFYYKPRLDLDKLASFMNGNCIAFSGHPGSDLANVIFKDFKAAYNSQSYDEAKSFLLDSSVLESTLDSLADLYQNIFGKGNFFLEIQLIDSERMHAAKVIAEVLRACSIRTGIPCVATPDAHYADKIDARDQRILLCASLHTNLRKVKLSIDNDEDVQLGGFFKSDKFYIPSPQDLMEVGHTKEELANSLLISGMCEKYKLSGQPKLPLFPTPNGKSQLEYATQICRNGWVNRVAKAVPKELHEKYAQRIKEELALFDGVGLTPYFLIVQDMIRHSVEDLGGLQPEGRGSVGGSLMAYLMGIHACDPISSNLYLSRFYNAGRNSPGRIKLPDIDCDFSKRIRDKVIDYVEGKYGSDKVAHIATFGTLKGREALTQVLKAHDYASHDQIKQITKCLPSDAAISDKLQEMVEEEGESSVIKWALENYPEDFKGMAAIDDNGNFTGPLASLFEQAYRIEGCKRNRGVHASGIVISSEPLDQVCPMVYDSKSGKRIAGFEYPDLEDMGVVKLDILGIAALDKLECALNYIEKKEVSFV